ncbi:ATP-binding cassette domain-containing protein [bacterium]|nr:ATP-binding cassette domain-containing protein [bacterium]
MTQKKVPLIQVSHLDVGYDGVPVMRDLTFDIHRGDIFVIMGGSGCGKSTILRTLTGLIEPISGSIHIGGRNFTGASPRVRDLLMRQMGVLFQGGALLTSMTVGENVALPLREYTDYTDDVIDDIVDTKLALVGLDAAADLYPAQLSGGMRKRAGLARALALDPEIVFFDEPSAGLDPVSSRALDDLILEINRSLGTTIVIVSHELESILTIGTNSIFLDCDARTITAQGMPRDLLRRSPTPAVRHFLTRGKQ